MWLAYVFVAVRIHKGYITDSFRACFLSLLRSSSELSLHTRQGPVSLRSSASLVDSSLKDSLVLGPWQSKL